MIRELNKNAFQETLARMAAELTRDAATTMVVSRVLPELPRGVTYDKLGLTTNRNITHCVLHINAENRQAALEARKSFEPALCALVVQSAGEHGLLPMTVPYTKVPKGLSYVRIHDTAMSAVTSSTGESSVALVWFWQYAEDVHAMIVCQLPNDTARVSADSTFHLPSGDDGVLAVTEDAVALGITWRYGIPETEFADEVLGAGAFDKSADEWADVLTEETEQ